MTESGLDFSEVRRAFDRAAASYDAHAVLQREVCNRLLERLDFMTLQPARVLDVGSGTGYGLAHLRTRYVAAELCAADIAPAMLAAARARLPQPTWAQRALQRLTPSPTGLSHLMCADMERLPLAPNSMNLVWSSLALQWAHDLEATFKGFYRVLAPGGLLMFATFGPDTLKELRAAFSSIDDAPHVNRFTDLHDIGDMLVNAGFSSPVMEMEMLTLTYADLKTLMRDLKGIGAHNAAVTRRRGLLGKSAWARLEQAYEAHRLEGRLPATFEVIYGHAWAGDKTQREDGRQVIQFAIGERKKEAGAGVKGLFVTGTDTGVGKTRVAVALIHALRAQGLRVAAMKPVSAGHAPGELNEDVVALLQAANVAADIRDVNPYAFAEPVAPHIAAQLAGVRIELDTIAAAYARLAAAADVVVVEGAGGWRVPLNAHEEMADLAQRLGLPVVLVVGLRLGCLSHALLTAESIAHRKLPWAGWVGNAIDPDMACQPENVASLRARLPGPCLGIHSYQPHLVPLTSPSEWLALPGE